MLLPPAGKQQHPGKQSWGLGAAPRCWEGTSRMEWLENPPCRGDAEMLRRCRGDAETAPGSRAIPGASLEARQGWQRPGHLSPAGDTHRLRPGPAVTNLPPVLQPGRAVTLQPRALCSAPCQSLRCSAQGCDPSRCSSLIQGAFSAADLPGDEEVEGPVWGQGSSQGIQPREREIVAWAGWALVDLMQDLFSLCPCPHWHLSLKPTESISREAGG